MGPSFMIKNSQRHSSGMIRQNAARNKGENRLKNATKPAFARRQAAHTPDAVFRKTLRDELKNVGELGILEPFHPHQRIRERKFYVS